MQTEDAKYLGEEREPRNECAPFPFVLPPSRYEATRPTSPPPLLPSQMRIAGGIGEHVAIGMGEAAKGREAAPHEQDGWQCDRRHRENLDDEEELRNGIGLKEDGLREHTAVRMGRSVAVVCFLSPTRARPTIDWLSLLGFVVGERV
jgi:hypothetical protein